MCGRQNAPAACPSASKARQGLAAREGPNDERRAARAVDLPQASDEVGEELLEAVRLVEGAQRQHSGRRAVLGHFSYRRRRSYKFPPLWDYLKGHLKFCFRVDVET